MPPQSSRGVHAPQNIVRRSATFLVAALLIVGVPLVAQALGDEPTFESALAEPAGRTDSPSPRVVEELEIATRPVEVAAAPEPAPVEEQTSPPDAAPEPDAAPTSDPAIDAAFLVLIDTYEWDERSLRVAALQQMLGMDADGWYAQATNRAHRAALEFAGLPTDALPAPVLPPGPSASQWAALRDCESGGAYSITSPSGKYRGAYQFDRSTWNSVAERHAPHLVGVDPAAASPVDQDTLASALYSERGARPWPHCGRHLR